MDHPAQPSVHNSIVSLSHYHNQALAFTHNPGLSCTSSRRSSLLQNAVPSHQALNNSDILPPQRSPTLCMSFPMQSRPKAHHHSTHHLIWRHSTSFTSGSAQLPYAQLQHSSAIPAQNPDPHKNNVQNHAAHQ